MGIRKILSSCETKGFTSVALPVIGAGIALKFPDSEVKRVLTEEMQIFEQERTGITPFLIRIVIHFDDAETLKVMEKFFSLKINYRKMLRVKECHHSLS